MSWPEVAAKHLDHRCYLRSATELECVDCSHKLLLPKEPRTLTHSGPPPYKAPDRHDLPSPELIALRKREALAAVEHARMKRTTATEETQ